jgi:hypothetical protein
MKLKVLIANSLCGATNKTVDILPVRVPIILAILR